MGHRCLTPKEMVYRKLICCIVIALTTLFLAMPTWANLKQGQKLTYDVTFGNILKGNAVVTYYGKIASFTDVETLTVLADSAIINEGLDFIEGSTLVIETDSIVEYSPFDSSGEAENDSSAVEAPAPLTVIKEKVHGIFYITYDTHFLGNVYNLHADIYTDSSFFPLLIETQITRTGKKSKGREQFYPCKNMAIFSQIIEGVEEIDTLLREHPLQDVTTLPFYFTNIENEIGDTLEVSLAQGEYRLSYVDSEIVEYGEGHDYRYYHTYRIESEPEGFKLWLSKKSKIPIRVDIKSQNLKMMLAKREIDKSLPSDMLDEDRIIQKLRHIFPRE